LLHLPIICSFSSYLFLELPYSNSSKALLTAAISVPLILVVSVLFNRLVDQKSIQFSRYLANLFHANENKRA
jgi:peptidoglycan/LPS O-acetylase OafA/YrhL